MNERIRDERFPQSEKELRREKGREAIFKAFLEGVSRFPQGFFGVSIFEGNEILQQQETPLDGFRSFNLNAKQMERLMESADRQHKTRDVRLHFGSAESDSSTRPNYTRTSNVWTIGQEITRERLIGVNALLHQHLVDESLHRNYDYTSPEIQAQVRAVFQAFVAALSSPEGKALTEDFVSLIQKAMRAGNMQILYEEVVDIKNRAHDLLYKEAMKLYSEENFPGLAKDLATMEFSNDWPAPESSLATRNST
jgi:hypothetical protein